MNLEWPFKDYWSEKTIWTIQFDLPFGCVIWVIKWGRLDGRGWEARIWVSTRNRCMKYQIYKPWLARVLAGCFCKMAVKSTYRGKCLLICVYIQWGREFLTVFVSWILHLWVLKIAKLQLNSRTKAVSTLHSCNYSFLLHFGWLFRFDNLGVLLSCKFGVMYFEGYIILFFCTPIYHFQL